MSERMRIDENMLDGLLREHFLIAEGSGCPELVFLEEHGIAVDEAKERALLERLRKDTRDGGYKGLLYGLTSLAVIGTVLLILFLQKRDAESSLSLKEQPPRDVPSVTADAKSPEMPSGGKTPFANTQPPVKAPENTTDISPPPQQPLTPTPQPGPVPEPAGFVFSAEEIMHYGMIREKVLREIIGISDKLYTKVEEGRVLYSGSMREVDAFVIRNFAITNLEYKVFLADLLATDRKDDYEMCLVRNSTWKDAGCETLSENYFRDGKYNNFPVVNISYEAALMYCEWLENRLNEKFKEKKGRSKKLSVRLPYDYEWIHAARVGYARVPDCGGYNTIFDAEDGPAGKSFKKRMASVKRNDPGPPGPLDKYYVINRYKMPEAEVMNIFEQALRYLGEVSDTLYPKGMDICNTAGHVSEIIHRSDGSMTVMGACWKSKEEYLEMLSGFNKNASSPVVGFRVVICNTGKGTYKDPFW